LLDSHGRCSVYADRPLGCRTFYCKQAIRAAEPARKELRQLLRALQDLAARHERNGDQPRPLSSALNER